MEISPKENVCEESLYNKLFETHSKNLYNFLYYKYGSENNPHDMVQEAFIKLWTNCHKVVVDKAKAFLFTVANNQMLSELAKKKTAQNYAEVKPVSYSNETPAFILEEKEYGEKLSKALSKLT